NLDGDTRNDAWLVSGALLMIALYIASPVRPHDTAWFHGSRLAVEAFGLLLAGYALPNPTRSFEWTMKALIGVCCLEALVGLAQQAIGTTRLVLRLHYTYGEQVRETSTGQLRSFGTLDEPFNYATLLLLGLVALMVTARGRILVPSLISVLLIVGLAASVVRTAALALAVIAAIWLLRKARLEAAIALLLAMVVASCALIALAPGATGNSGGAANFILTLNGRTTVWGQLINSPTAWIAGRGVGAVGTGANRAQSGSVYQPTRGGSPVAARTQTDVDKFNVDSSYLSFVADVGLVGLALLLALFARILKLGVTAARRGSDAGWAAVTITIVMLIDATTRTSLTSFPVGFIALVLIGLSLAACQHDRRPVAARL
ncbi:MAG: hypothetical protein QOJ07_3018, partial [Thermoleophilaceae bacterium]|nr:hypothetical protein [Thermoleophilaceae bacterium]